MSLTWSNSPAAEAIANVLESIHPEGVARRLPEAVGINREQRKKFLVLSYREDFSRLWQFDKDLLNWAADRTCSIILVWDGMPQEDGIEAFDIKSHLTAFDWVVALSLTSIKLRQPKKQAERIVINIPMGRIYIADLESQNHQSAYGVQIFQRLQQNSSPLLSWLSVLRSADININEIINGALNGNQPYIDTEFIRNLWSISLIRPSSDRHAIANLIGPRVLLAGMGAKVQYKTKTSLVKALDTLMQSVELSPSPTDDFKGPWFKDSDWKDHVDKFVVIDDMSELGWSQFIKTALGLRPEEGDRRLEIFFNVEERRFGSSSNQSLLNLLVRTKQGVAKLNIGGGVSLCGSKREVLFLDLRLFSGQKASDEYAFFAQLLELAKTVPVDRNDLPWSGITESEIKAVSQCIKKQTREQSDYFVALTLLPRLLALVDPTLPIILFSSTGRKEIAALLRPYGNIILDFDKPRFFGDSISFVLADTRDKFVKSLKQAVKIVKGRSVYQSLLSSTQQPVLKTKTHNQQIGITKESIAEIYIEESGTSIFSVGGMMLIYPDADAVGKLDEALKKQDLIWGLAEGHRPLQFTDRPPKNYLKKKPTGYESDLKKIDAIFNSLNIHISAFSLINQVSKASSNSNLSPLLREESVDNLYRNMLAEVLEATLFELKKMLSPSSSSISIDVATRIVKLSDKKKLEGLTKEFGIRPRPSNDGFYSLSPNDVYPIVTRVLASRRKSAKGLSPKRARGVTLYDHETLNDMLRNGKTQIYERIITEQKQPRPQQVHYLADWLTRFAVGGVANLPSTARLWFENGFLQERNQEFYHWLKAGRESDNGNLVEAMIEASKAKTFESRRKSKECDFGRWVKEKIGNRVRSLKGADFLELCDRL